MDTDDSRDYPNVSFPEAREVASVLGWTERLEAEVSLAEGVNEPGGVRKLYIHKLVNGIGDALLLGTAWEDFPEVARAFYHRATADPGQEGPPPSQRPDWL
jgi:hypothetical protein